MPIQILPPDVAAKIAAGEVVERPANVAKELIENSLDAGATEIRVEIREGGQRLLRIIDNGHGMMADEAALAFARHATSKLQSADDLNHIATFGFRGEALYSIAAVSKVTLTTRHTSEEFGSQLRVEGGVLVGQNRAGMPTGTIINVEHLFFNMPARLKFLRKAPTEAGQISAVVQHYALAYPDRRFSLVHDGRLLFQSTGNGELLDVLVKIYGLENARQMTKVGSEDWRLETGDRRPETRDQRLETGDWRPETGDRRPETRDQRLETRDQGRETRGADQQSMVKKASKGDLAEEVNFMVETPSSSQSPVSSLQSRISVFGYTSLPTLTRANRSNIDLFVNRRYVEDRTLTHAVVQAYHTLLPVGRFPVAVILIDLDPSLVDVNVHPQKTQVRFVDERAVFSAVQKAVRRAILTNAPIPEMGLPAGEPSPAPGDAPGWAEGASPTSGWSARRQQILNAGQRPLDIFIPEPASTPPPTPGAATTSALAPTTSSPALTPEPERQAVLAQRSRQLPVLRVVGQIGAMYIVTEGPEGMYLIDQHAAHERILYEKFMAQRYGAADGEVARQHLLEPLTLHIGHELTGMVAHHLEQLDRVGFTVEPFGGDTFLVRAVPSVLSGQDPLRNLEEIVTALADRRSLVEEELEARLVKMVCKRAAIKAGQLLSTLEMQELVRQLEECQSPRTCPHGRPTMIQLSAGELEKAFGRV